MFRLLFLWIVYDFSGRDRIQSFIGRYFRIRKSMNDIFTNTFAMVGVGGSNGQAYVHYRGKLLSDMFAVYWLSATEFTALSVKVPTKFLSPLC